MSQLRCRFAPSCGRFSWCTWENFFPRAGALFLSLFWRCKCMVFWLRFTNDSARYYRFLGFFSVLRSRLSKSFWSKSKINCQIPPL